MINLPKPKPKRQRLEQE